MCRDTPQGFRPHLDHVRSDSPHVHLPFCFDVEEEHVSLELRPPDRFRPLRALAPLIRLQTFIESLLIGLVCAAYERTGAGEQILIAFGITMGLFICLTAFTMQSKIDWSFLGAGIFACLWILIIWGLIVALLGWRTSFLYSLFGAILFCLFIIYDTNQICKHLGYDDYIIAAIDLYLDILNLFLFILQLLGRKD